MRDRIPDDVIIPALVAMTGSEEKADEKKGPGCCGCLTAIVLLYVCGSILYLIFNGFQ